MFISQTTNVSVVAFDLDGVLMDTLYGVHQATIELMEEAGVLNPPDFKTFCEEFDMPHEPFHASYGLECTPVLERRFLELLEGYKNLAEPYPGMVQVVKQLQVTGIGLAVISAANHRRVHELLDRFNLRQFFGPVYTDDPCKVRNLITCCRDLGCPPSEFCYIGDRPSDMRDATQAGVIPIGFAADYDFMRPLLKKAGARVVVDDPDEILEQILVPALTIVSVV